MSHPQERYQGVFAKVEFPPYKFVEYPKWIQDNAGQNVIVHSQQEELRIKGELVPVGAIVGVEAERDDLAKQVEELRAKLAALDAPQAPAKPEHPEPKIDVKPAVVNPALARKP